MVNKYAYLFVDYFCTKVELFLSEVMAPIMGIKESFIRYEFQSRGAVHAHCILSVMDGPSLEDSELAFDDSIDSSAMEDIKEYFRLLDLMAQRTVTKEDLDLDDLAAYRQGKEQFEKLRKIEAAKQIIIRYGSEHLGISCMHPNMDPHHWKRPYGDVSCF